MADTSDLVKTAQEVLTETERDMKKFGLIGFAHRDVVLAAMERYRALESAPTMRIEVTTEALARAHYIECQRDLEGDMVPHKPFDELPEQEQRAFRRIATAALNPQPQEKNNG